MAELRPIPTPLIYRWRRFLQNIVPFLIFLIGLMLTLWLWDRQSQMGNAVGVAEAQFVDVASGSAGILMPPGHGEWREFQTVKKGEAIGGVALSQLGTFRAQVETIQKEKDKVQADREAARQKFLLDMDLLAERQDDRWFEVRRLYWRIEDVLQDAKDRQTRIATAQAELRTLQTNFRYNENSQRAGGAISDQAVDRSRYRVRELEQTIAKERAAIRVAKENGARSFAELKKIKATLDPSGLERASKIRSVVQSMAAPFNKQLEVLDARTREIQAAMESSVIVSPIAGVITQVYKVPGEAIQPGEAVVRIASPNTNYIVTYIRQRQRIQPIPNMAVKLRTRYAGSRPIDSTVVEVGPTVEPIPQQHQMDPTRPEWGYPIKIALPKDLQGLIRPGESVDIIFPARIRSAGNESTGDDQTTEL